MIRWRSHLCVTLIIIQICVIHGQNFMKSSLTFVIDDSQSMTDEIEQVQRNVDSIFDVVMNANNSNVENFVLVTFNDPDYIVHVVTNDQKEFKSGAEKMHIRDGIPECSELALTGIKAGLENSLPMSSIYVITDASAKDFAMYEEIKSIAQKKQTQLTFMLTGDCGSTNDSNYQVYNKLAKATSGEVFNLKKNDINDLLEYVKEKAKGKADVIATASFAPGYGNKFNVTVDSKTDDLLITLVGKNPKVQTVTDPDGKTANIHNITIKDEVAIVKVTDPKIGVHVVDLGSESETEAKALARSSVNFQPGFSSFEPTSISHTATRPAADGNTFLSIQLYGEGVKLDTAKILDMNDKVLTELPLRIIDEKAKFYVTKSFDAPHGKMFKVAVYGIDVNTKTPITRISLVPIERRYPTQARTVEMAPTVKIEEGPKVTTDYNSPLQLTCKVQGYPKPEIIWQEKDTGLVLSTTVFTIEEPYDYINILKIAKSDKNCTYQCKATNSQGVNVAEVDVEAIAYFNVIESPKELMEIQYGEEGSIICKVEAIPPATITWYKDRKLLTNNSNDDIFISNDKSTVSIKCTNLECRGYYICEATNNINKTVFSTTVSIPRLEKPAIKKILEEVHVIEGADAVLNCQCSGHPKPTIQWYFQRQDSQSKFIKMNETSDTLHLKNVTSDDAGLYKCKAMNEMGSDKYVVRLILPYPPIIKAEQAAKILAKKGEVVIVGCDVTGHPKPTVTWLKNGTILTNTQNIHLRNKGLRITSIDVSDIGYYTCEAKNSIGSAKKTVFIDVYAPATIKVPDETRIITKLGSNETLICQADGYPTPEIEWSFISSRNNATLTNIQSKEMTLELTDIQVKDLGYYICKAKNAGGPFRILYEVLVNDLPST